MGVPMAIFETGGMRTEHYVPGVYSRSVNVVNSSGVSAGNLCIIGEAMGGRPQSLMCFSSPSEAKRVLLGGALLDAVCYAFSGSNTYTPQKVYAVRVNKATQSQFMLTSGDEPNKKDVILMKSWDYGKHTNRLKIDFNTGTADACSITISYGAERYSEIIKNEVLHIEKEADSSGDTNVGNVKVSGEGSDRVLTVGDTQTFHLADYETLSDLANAVSNAGYPCTVMGKNGSQKADILDNRTIDNAGGEAVLYANVEAIRNALLASGYVGDAEIKSHTIPSAKSDFFTGGSNFGFIYNNDGQKTGEKTEAGNEDYADALTFLETQDVQIVGTSSTKSEVHTLISNHCTQMSSTINRKERTCILGGAVGMKDEDAIEEATALNNRLTSFVCDTATASNVLTGESEEIGGAMLACMLCGMESAMAVNMPLTNKALKVLAVAKRRSISELENLIKGGVVAINPSPDNLSQIVCIRAITTFGGDGDLINCERSMVREDLYMNRDLRSCFALSIGLPNKASTADIVQTLKTRADEWKAQGYIVTGENGNVWNIRVKIDGDKVYLEFDRYLTAPTNFVFFTVTNHVYTASVEL